jgi:uncharacterized protein
MFDDNEKQLLLKAVDEALQYGLVYGRVMPVDLTNYPSILTELGACFVTLEINGTLRGCIGSLEAHQPLIVDVVSNAFAAAFCDPRFYPLTKDEYPKLTKHISVLRKPEPLVFTSEEDLIAKLRPNVDGLILQDQGRRGTFLPIVWEQIPKPREFLQHLKVKAGLSEDYWSDSIKVFRYTAELI